MKERIGVVLLVAATGCGGDVVSDPAPSSEELVSDGRLASNEGSRAVDEVEHGSPAAAEAYACDVVAVSAGTPYTFVSLGKEAYAGFCSQTSAPAPVGCWYTGPRSCDSTGPCGGFRGSRDSVTDVFTLQGGQHMLCEYPCVSDSDCPAPSSGTARASCMRSPEFNPATDGGSCMLGCADGATCPDGFVCIEPGLAFGLRDGSSWPAPAQCVQYEAITMMGSPYPE
jgi:hypothetical protein